jgi:SAM-dependent methyltransferase
MSFVLSETAGLAIVTAAGDSSPEPRWRMLPHLSQSRPCLVLQAGDRWQIPLPNNGESAEFFMSFGRGTPGAASHGALKLEVLTARGLLDLLRVSAGNREEGKLTEIRLSLDELPPANDGQLFITAEMAPHGDKTAQIAAGEPIAAVAIAELVIGPRHLIPLLRARAFPELRLRNEIAHFGAVYDHHLFEGRRQRAQSAQALPRVAAVARPAPSPRPEISDLTPNAGEDVYHFAHRLLGAGLRIKPPDFHQRLANLAAGGRRDIISLCVGTGQIEASLVRSTNQPVALTLVDINRSLLDQAEALMPPHCATTSIVQDVNEIALPSRHFDIAIFVSGAHHVVELEHLWQELHRALRDDGELWLIGEQIGPNGNRLDIECFEAANRAFSALPERLRRNAYTGDIDREIPNIDHAEATFEGIRSQEIEATLARHFLPVEIYKRNCFLWRMVNQAYSDNYDLSQADDIATIRSLVKAEIDYFLAGGTATELHGVYRAIA